MFPSDARPLRPPPPAFVIRAILWLRQHLLTMARRVVPPDVHVAELATGLAWSQALSAIVRARVADALGDDPVSAGELALRLGVDPDLLHRTLRVLATRGIFHMERDGRFRHSPASRTLRQDHPSALSDFVQYFTSGSNAEAWAHFDWTLRTGKSAFEHVHGMSVWAWFERHEDERDTFARAMTGFTRADAPVIARLYPFGETRLVCDIGGGRGLLLSEILLVHPHTSGLLCDAPGVLAAADALLRHRGVRDRVALVPGNFFEVVPPGADAYLLKNVLHDWDTSTCVRLLQKIHAAAAPHGRLLVAETLVPRLSRDPVGTAADLQMAVACSGGRERALDEFEGLFAAAGFALHRTFRSPLIAIVEARPA
jgi:hypothetical protein